VTDSKIVKLFVDDEPFWLPNANLLSYDRRLNMRSGTPSIAKSSGRLQRVSN
jgi:alpha,alpha-trehalose phosphorylase